MNRPKYPTIKNVNAIGFADAWSKLVKTCMDEGALKKRFYGKPVNTYDIISLTEIKHPLHPFAQPMLHPQFPTKELHCAEYEKQWERTYDWKKQGFEYNYMDRLINYPPVDSQDDNVLINYYNKRCLIEYERWASKNEFIDQLKVIRENIAKRIEKGGDCLVSNRDQAITWIPDRDLFVPEDQPCLQRLQFFVYEYPYGILRLHESELVKGKAEFHAMWRSRDGFTAWNSNMIGLTKMLNKEIFEPNNLELIKVVDFCNSFHIYESDWEEAYKVKPAVVNPMLIR